MNDGLPTMKTLREQITGTINLRMVSADLATTCFKETLKDSYSTDHFPVLLGISLKFEESCSSSNRLRLRNVNREGFNYLIGNRIAHVGNTD